MRKTWEILNKIEELKEIESKESLVQITLLEYVLASKEPSIKMAENLKFMYDATLDKNELTNENAQFKLDEVVYASNILAWLVEIPNKIHKKNLKKLKKSYKEISGAESFLKGL